MTSLYNKLIVFNVKNSSKLLLPFLFVSKPQPQLHTFKKILTRNIVWQHNALRRISEKEQRMKKDMKKDGKILIEKNKIYNDQNEKSGLKTSKLREIFNKKEKSIKKKESEDESIEEKEQYKYKQDLVRQIQLHQNSRLNKRAFLLQMINKKCNPNLSLKIEKKSTRIKKINSKEISTTPLSPSPSSSPSPSPSSSSSSSSSLSPSSSPPSSSNNNNNVNYDPNWRENENLPGWLRHRIAMKERIGFKNWKPHKKVNREVMDKIRWLNNQSPEEYNAEKLSTHFKISPESIRRILKSKFIPNSEILERQERKYNEKLIKFKQEMKMKRKSEVIQSTTNQSSNKGIK